MRAGDKQVEMGTRVQPHSPSQEIQQVMSIELGVTRNPSLAGRNSRNGPSFPGNSQPRAPGSISTSVHLHPLENRVPFTVGRNGCFPALIPLVLRSHRT